MSNRTGIVKDLSCVRRGIEEPDPPIVYRRLCRTSTCACPNRWLAQLAARVKRRRRRSSGRSGKQLHSCASSVDARRIRLAKWSAVEHEAIAPPEFVLYSPTQYARTGFPYQRWNPKDEVRWVAARELRGDSVVFVPARIVYLSGLGDRGQDCLCPLTSNGLAAGLNREAAVLHGLYELIERDSFLIHWMNQLPGQEIEVPAGEGLASSIVSHYRLYGVEVRTFNLSTDLPAYVLMSVAFDPSGAGPATVIGLGCHLDPRVALVKSLMELCQGHPGERLRYRNQPPADRLKRYEDVRSVCDHSAFLSIPERLKEFDFLLKHGCRKKVQDLANKSLGTVERDLDACVNSLSHQGCRVCYVDLTTSDVSGCGMHVVRTLATGLQPIHFGFGMERLGGRRLFEVPQRLGLSPEVRAESDLNPCPHPLS